MKLPDISTLQQSKKALIVAIAFVLCLGGALYVYYGRNTANVYNASGFSTNNPQNPITTTNSNKSTAGTITVPCKCQLKNLQTQPGQTSTSGSTLQGGSTGSTQVQTCNPCTYSSAENPAIMCPEYLCKAPTPTPLPSPTPTPVPLPSPTPGCGTCGGGYRKTGTTSSMYICPMYCVE
jgi:hypothetical protein